MSGTKIGGIKASNTIKQRDPDFYRKIGKMGGMNGHTGGFASMPIEKVREAGRKGGTISRRGKAKHEIKK